MIVAGPCSAESESMLQEMAELLKSQGLHYLRSGLWKPRTRPDEFEGHGELALPWLARIQKEMGITPIVEVAHPKHVEKCFEAGIKNFWLGARTTINPFAVNEIVQSFENKAQLVFVKNPMTPDLSQWVGAIERVRKSKVQEIVAVHRGFSHFYEKKLRNDPFWEIPLELKKIFPGMKLLCDPSHIAGLRQYVPEISQMAMDLNFDGLMVEVHPSPEGALTDSKQQLNFSEFQNLLQSLQLRSSDQGPSVELEVLRKKIDEIDQRIYELVAKRLELIDQVAHHKFKNKLTSLSYERFLSSLEARKEIARKLGIDEINSEQLYRLLHSWSLEMQEKAFHLYSSQNFSEIRQ